MKIKINGIERNCKSAQRSSINSWVIKGISPHPGSIDGAVEIIRRDGVVETVRYRRAVSAGDTIWLTNLPQRHPMAPERSMEYKLAIIRDEGETLLELAADNEYRLSLMGLGLTEGDLSNAGSI